MVSPNEPNRILSAALTSLNEGVVELLRDWKAGRLPPVSFDGEGVGRFELSPLPPSDYAVESRYFIDEDGLAVFVFDPEEYPAIDYAQTAVFLAGPFNGWPDAVGDEDWLLDFERINGRRVLALRLDPKLLDGARGVFKFVTEAHHWLPVDVEAPNASRDVDNNFNYAFDLAVSGRHRFKFVLARPVDLSESYSLIYSGKGEPQRAALHPGAFFFELSSDKEMGASLWEGHTTFRLFAPRAKWVKVGFFKDLDAPKQANWVLMKRDAQGVWETAIGEDLAGYYYWFKLDGPSGEFGLFDPKFLVLDPYAKATVSRNGPGIVIDDSEFEDEPLAPFRAPEWQDLVILEAHTRDLVAGLGEKNRGATGFGELSEFSESAEFYPSLLGVNAIELQPVQENDAMSLDEYHWGYMTSNYMAPASMYGSDPASGSQVREFRELVRSLHERGLSVILDVVYNHVGEPAHLMFVDKEYYFHLTSDGAPTNWSGCGNDLRSESPMATRLIIDSLLRFVTFYGVDGFRFDLADLVGKPVLMKIEAALKAVRPDIILIAEPWSFRGHIGMELRDTGYASWNDGYRENVRKYLLGAGDEKGMAYFLKGSPHFYASWPAQTVNYLESHDDRVWIDMITEREGHDGSHPTALDQRRTRLMIATLMMSIGIPMLHQGMDFMASKGGVNNTYKRGDLNALDYARLREYAGTHDYFRAWIAFRKSDLGRLLRHYVRTDDTFFDFIYLEGRTALAAVYNGGESARGPRLLFALNPEGHEAEFPLGAWAGQPWRMIANHERFWLDGAPLAEAPAGTVRLPPVSLGLWIAGG